MKVGSLFYTVALTLGGIALLFAANLLSMFWNPYPEKYIHHNEVRGMAIESKGIPFTLNFEQQNEVVDLLNQSDVTTSSYPQENFPFQRLIIYRFDLPDLLLSPIATQEGDLVLSSSDLPPNKHLRDVSQGRLSRLLSQTYDP